jgi:hypothetical protein
MLKTVSSIVNAIGALNYKGTWNASTNTPTITSGVGVKGDYYVVSVAGATAIDGISNWGVGDWITFNGTVWQRVEGGADLNGVNLSVSGTTTLDGLTQSTALALDASKNVVSVNNTGSGDNVLATTPSFASTIGLGGATASASGAGVTFPATQSASTDVNTLDDYEEGTWTPGSSTITFTSASGTYTKIGDTVHLYFAIVFPTTSDAGSANITGLPFSAGTSFRNGAALGIARDSGTDFTIVAFNNVLQIYNRTGGLTTNANNSTKEYSGVVTYKV